MGAKNINVRNTQEKFLFLSSTELIVNTRNSLYLKHAENNHDYFDFNANKYFFFSLTQL